MSVTIPAALRRLVVDRAAERCEYCRLHSEDAILAHEVDHVVAVKHRGPTEAGNLAYTCFVCNRSKGSDVASIDVETGRIERLFNPRTDDWKVHFQFDQGRIDPLTAIGRVTEYLLKFNLPEHVETRKLLARTGRY